MVNPHDYGEYDPAVHPLPSPAKAQVGDKVNSYDGKGVVLNVEPSQFYGQPPVSRGEPVPGEWDGLVYVVRTNSGVTSFDRSRIQVVR